MKPKNDVMPIIAALKIPVSGLTVTKKRGLATDSQEEQVMKFVKETSKIGKFFVTPVLRIIDISTGKKDDQAI